MNDLDKMNVIRSNDDNDDMGHKRSAVAKKISAANAVDAGQFNAEAANLGVNLPTLQKLFKHFDRDHDGMITTRERDEALRALTSRMNQLIERMEGEIGDEHEAYDNEKDNQAFIGKILGQLITDAEDDMLIGHIRTLMLKLQAEGLSPEVLQKTVSILTDIAPPIDTRA